MFDNNKIKKENEQRIETRLQRFKEQKIEEETKYASELKKGHEELIDNDKDSKNSEEKISIVDKNQD